MQKNTSKFDDEKIAVLDGKLHVFRRPDTKFWWCGYHNSGVYLRTSTKKASLADATEAAKEWYYGQQVMQKHGFVPIKTKDTYAHHAKLALEEYDRKANNDERSLKYAAGLRSVIENALIPFFGRHSLKSINQQLWNEYLVKNLHTKNVKASTIKHHLNGIRIVFRCALIRGDVEAIPTFYTYSVLASQATPRTWFNEQEFRKLTIEIQEHIRRLKKTRWSGDALELYDYVIFIAATGLRVDEGKNLRFKDIKIIKERDENAVLKEILHITNIKGKRGTGECKSHFDAVAAFNRIKKRRGFETSWETSDEPVFQAHHRDMFNKILNNCGLKVTNSQPPLRRDLMSLRNTYICNRLLAGANVYDVAKSCRTSVDMIERHYSRWLSPVKANINMSKQQTEEQKNIELKKEQETKEREISTNVKEFLQKVDEEINNE